VGASGGQGGKKGKAFAKDKEEALLKAKRKEIMERAGGSLDWRSYNTTSH
jgi:hypothetical protein